MVEIDKRPMKITSFGENGNLKQETVPFDNLSFEQKMNWYFPICSQDEISRILNMQNGDDYLLRLLADTIIDNMRAYRVVSSQAKELRLKGKEWSLLEHFKTECFKNFKENLPQNLKIKVQNISCGHIFSKETNGYIFETPFGICSAISYSLKYFVLFSSLALLDFENHVPEEVRLASMRIAIRTMIEKESLDFDLDPRGIIPDEIKNYINHPYPYISTFLAGHEFSHFLNGDIKDKNTSTHNLINPEYFNAKDYRKVITYNSSQEREFAADLGAMNYPLFSEEYYAVYYNYTLLWFTMLAIYESVEDYVFPITSTPTHPGAYARYQNILQKARKPIDYDYYLHYYEEILPNLIKVWSERMQNDVAENYDLYEMYGSIYLAAPNTKWRGKELKDRIDY